jgi:hypothetical protein
VILFSFYFIFEKRAKREVGERRNGANLFQNSRNNLLTPSPRIIAPYADATLARILLDLFLERLEEIGAFGRKEKRGKRSKE